MSRPVARRGAEAPVQLRLDVGRARRRPALARHVLAVRRGERARGPTASRRARGDGRAGARRRGKARAATRGRGRPAASTPLCRRDIPSDTSRRNAARQCLPFSSPCRCQVCRLLTTASETRKRKNGGRPNMDDALPREPERQRASCLFVTHLFPMSTSRGAVLYFFLFRSFDASRGYFVSVAPHRRHLPGASSRTPHPLAVPGLRLVVPRGRTHLSRTSMFGASADSGCARPRTAPFQGLLSRVPAASSPPVRAPGSVSGARTLPAIASRVARSSATSSVGGESRSPRDSGASLVRRVSEKISPDVSRKKRSASPVSRLRPPASPPPPTQASACAHGRRRQVPHRALRPRRDGPGASLAPRTSPVRIGRTRSPRS